MKPSLHPMPRRLRILGLLLLPGLLSGCGPAVVTGVALGAAVLHDRRDTPTVLADSEIEYQAMQIGFSDPGIGDHCRVGAHSYNLVVLATGQCTEVTAARRFTEFLSRLPKVRRVVDEIRIGPLASLTQESEDILIGSRVLFALTQVNHGDFDVTRVKVVTESGIVYLMGLLTPEEARAVVEKVRYVSGVKKVVKIFEYIQTPA